MEVFRPTQAIKMLILAFLLILTSVGCAAQTSEDGSIHISKFKIAAPVSGRYVPWRAPGDSIGFYAGEIITIEGSSFHYRQFSDVSDRNYPPPNYSGSVSVFKDHIFLNHPGVPFPYRIAGKADGRSVLMTWKAHGQWKRTGKVYPGDVLFLEKEAEKPPVARHQDYNDSVF